MITPCSSTVITKIRDHIQDHPSSAFVYFYFDFNDAEKQGTDKAIRSLIMQFSALMPSTPDALTKLYSSCIDGTRQPTTGALTATLRQIVGHFQHSYVVLDALDECKRRQELLDFIEELINWKMDGLHLLVTSRKEEDIKNRLDRHISAQIDLQSTLVDEDIQLHVHETLKSDPKLQRWPADVKREVETALIKGAHGM